MRSASLLALAWLAVACAHAPVRKEVVWPEPPDTARIRFVQAFRQTEDLDDSGWSRVGRAILGGTRDPSIGTPMGVAISDDGDRLYIADFGASQVLVADFKGKRVTQFAPDENVGKPFNVAVDGQENVYVSDSAGHAVHVFTKSGSTLRTIGTNDLERPTGIAIDRERQLLYVSDSASRKSENHRVRVFSLEGKLLRDLGAPTGQTTKGAENGQFYFPTYLALDKEGNIYVSDSMNFRIQEFSPEGAFIRKAGENGDAPGSFARLKGLAFDSFGNLYAVDGGHSNVQIFNTAFQPLMYFGAYSRRLEDFDVPSGIAIDPAHNRIYVCNEYISRINVYELINTTAEDSKPQKPKKLAQAKE